MWRSIVLVGILITLPTIALCDAVQFTVNPANIGAFRSMDQATSINGTVPFSLLD